MAAFASALLPPTSTGRRTQPPNCTHAAPDAVRRMIVLSANAGINAFADAFRLRKD
jgi:hypothetical protein